MFKSLDSVDASEIRAKDGTAAVTIADDTGAVGIGDLNVTGGTINNTTIGATTASTGAFTTLSASTSLTTPVVTNAGTLALSATGANIVTASTNGVERLRIDSSGNVGIGATSPTSALTVQGTITGTAVTQSATDTTAGRLTKVGDFGIGGTAEITDISQLDDPNFPTGIYNFNASSSLPGPLGAVGGWTLYHQTASSISASQIAVRRTNPPDGGNTFTRSFTSGDWTDWRNSYDNRNILGTVSESSGTPTGAIIERGSNANGEFVRYADGTQICTRGSLVLIQEFGDRLNNPWTYPAVFSDAPAFSATVINSPSSNTTIRNNISAIGPLSTPGTSSLDAYCRLSSTVADPGDTITISSLLAIGRWF
jgi:hypothetical protein